MAALDDDLQFLKGVGPQRVEALHRLGWRTVGDVLHAFPRLLGPPPAVVEQGPVPSGIPVRVKARVVAVRPRFARGRGMGLEVRLARADGFALVARFFNAGWLRQKLVIGEWFLFEGRTDASHAGVLLQPSLIHLAQGPATVLPSEEPCRVAYRLTEGVSENAVRGLVDQVLAGWLAQARDPLGLLPDDRWQDLLRTAHRPPSAEAHEAARRELARRELTALAWVLQHRRAAVVERLGRAWRCGDDIVARALARLPFTLTPGQQTAIDEILPDLRAAVPMYRLLQGDVGTGKTALALVAALLVIADGAQAALLAPTAVLAAQHAGFIRRCLAGTRVVVRQLTGGTPAVERAAILAEVADGRCHLLIGTHALLEDDVAFHDLGLAVIDEQHKFGVAQRSRLVGKATGGRAGTGAGNAGSRLPADLLLMTATPIPRTLALTAFGDLAVSRINGRPPGRAAVASEVVALDRECTALTAVAEALARLAPADRALVVCARRDPADAGVGGDLLPETGTTDTDDSPPRTTGPHDAASVFTRLQRSHGVEVALLTGSMAEAAKLAVMERFAAGQVRILVATTVVEVGIDVAELALLVVLDADRFGLAQLHQLRGRLGRGDRPGRCLLLPSDHAGPDGLARLACLATSDDGLAIAEADLAARGPGALLGTAQHGQLRLRVADLSRDLDLLQEAHQQVRSTHRVGQRPPQALLAWGLGPEGLGGSGLLSGG